MENNIEITVSEKSINEIQSNLILLEYKDNLTSLTEEDFKYFTIKAGNFPKNLEALIFLDKMIIVCGDYKSYGDPNDINLSVKNFFEEYNLTP